MKKSIILILSSSLMFIVGCSKEEEIDPDVVRLEEAQVLLEELEYDAAKEIFSELLLKDEENEKARAMYMQAYRVQNAQNYEEAQNYERAIKELEIVEGIKHGSNEIKDLAKDKKKELEKLQESYLEDAAWRKESAKEIARAEISRVEKGATKATYDALPKPEPKPEEEIPPTTTPPSTGTTTPPTTTPPSTGGTTPPTTETPQTNGNGNITIKPPSSGTNQTTPQQPSTDATTKPQILN